MKKACSIIFLLYYSLGTILFPLGDWSRMAELKQMYQQCQQEDWDITPVEFVLEHMLVLQPLAAHFEGQNEENADDKQHQTVFSHAAAQVCTVCPQPILIAHPRPVYPDRKVFFISSDGFVPQSFGADVFRPPIV